MTRFQRSEFTCRKAANPHVLEEVDPNGSALGFSITGVSALRDAPLEVAL